MERNGDQWSLAGDYYMFIVWPPQPPNKNQAFPTFNCYPRWQAQATKKANGVVSEVPMRIFSTAGLVSVAQERWSQGGGKTDGVSFRRERHLGAVWRRKWATPGGSKLN